MFHDENKGFVFADDSCRECRLHVLLHKTKWQLEMGDSDWANMLMWPIVLNTANDV